MLAVHALHKAFWIALLSGVKHSTDFQMMTKPLLAGFLLPT